MEKINNSDLSKNIIRVLKGSGIAIILSIIILLIYAILLTYTPIQENTIKPVIIVVSGISILIGSGISTLKINKNGILNGALVGLIYIIFLYLLSSIIITNFSLTTNSFIMILVSVFTGIIGGIIGINIK